MNEKTAKLLRRYATAKGADEKQLKREWTALNSKERFLKRQSIIKELIKK